ATQPGDYQFLELNVPARGAAEGLLIPARQPPRSPSNKPGVVAPTRGTRRIAPIAPAQTPESFPTSRSAVSQPRPPSAEANCGQGGRRGREPHPYPSTPPRLPPP